MKKRTPESEQAIPPETKIPESEPIGSEPIGSEAVGGEENGQCEEIPSEKKAGKKIKGKRPLAVCACVLASLLFVGIGWAGGYFSVDSRARSLARMTDLVAKNYYLGVDKDELYNSLYDGFELDKFCTHYTEEEYRQVISESDGKNAGYGLSLTTAEETARVYHSVYNSPAERAGVESGMYITAFGPSPSELKTGSRDETLSFLRSNESCAIAVGYEEDGSDARTVTLSRETYLGSYCMYADAEGTYRFRTEGKELALTRIGDGMALPEDTAYIRVREFDGNVGKEFAVCLEKMKDAGRENLVLDLRSNGGGYLSALCDMAAHLLKEAKGKSPVVASAPDYEGGVTYRASGNDFSAYFSENSRIRVLADENSASASEALIGAMLCYKTISYEDIYLRRTEDGSAHTYGKGVMQSHFTAPDGNVVRLTVSRILWPDGETCIHGKGITEEDGANAVEAPLLPSAEDTFLARFTLPV